MPGGILTRADERNVKSNYVTLFQYLVQRAELFRTLTALTRRVVEKHLHSEGSSYLGDLGSYVADSHHPESQVAESKSVFVSQKRKQRGGVLLDRPGVATRSIAPEYAVAFAPGGVNMVKAYSRSRYHLDGRAFQQGRVALGSGARDYGIGIADQLGGRIPAGQIHNFGIGFKYAL